jgi:anhydro-N-acetylmuramic acid kinase
MLACGLMSGTSLDGIDAALVRLEPRAAGYDVDLIRFSTVPFPERLRKLLRAALPPNEPSPERVAALDGALGRAFGRAARAVAAGSALDFTASHGLTLFHDGTRRRSVQIGDPYAIREATGATVVFDFRRADCAAGGQGAPLVPFADALLFGSAQTTVALNLGGIANMTVVPPGAAPSDVRAWDTGPGNLLIDAFVRARSGGTEFFDRDGARAARGRVDVAALEMLLADPYFALAPPKSTGRERFGETFLATHRASLDALSFEDGCATLTALTVEAIARDVARSAPDAARVVASGGGTHNAALLRALAERLGSGVRVVVSDELGVNADAKEALAFAILGYEALRGRPAGLPSVTGARRAAVLGAIVPHELGALLAKLERELAAKR